MDVRTTALLVTIALALAVVAAPRPGAGQIRESAERLAREAAAAQLTSSRRVTSKGRVTAGLVLAAAGGGMVLYALSQCAAVGPDAGEYSPPLTASYDGDSDECVLDRRPNFLAPRVYAEPDRDPRILWSGAGIGLFGLLLAVAWSDVDANDSLTFHLRPGSVGVARKIGW